MTESQTRTPRWLTILIALLVLAIAVMAFWLSFHALLDLTERAGIAAPGIAWMWPAVVDIGMIVAILVMLAWRDRDWRTRGWPLATFVLLACSSVAGNTLHTTITHDPSQGVSQYVAIAMGAVPPLALIVFGELLVRVARPRAATEATAMHDDPAIASHLAEPAALHGEASVADVASATETSSHDVQAELTPACDAMHVAAEIASHVEPSHADAAAALVARDVAAPPERGDATASEPEPHPAIATPATEPVAPAPPMRLHAVEPAPSHVAAIPADKAGQIAWIVARAEVGDDTTWPALASLLREAGHSLSDRTVQARLTEARKQAPEAFAA